MRYRSGNEQVKDLGDRLGELGTLIEWKPYREIVGELYTNTNDHGGRPNIDGLVLPGTSVQNK
jgi:IS5 family transposase